MEEKLRKKANGGQLTEIIDYGGFLMYGELRRKKERQEYFLIIVVLLLYPLVGSLQANSSSYNYYQQKSVRCAAW